VYKHSKSASFSQFPPPGWRYDVVRLVQASIAGAKAFVDQPKFDASLHAPRNVMLVVRGDGLRLLDAVQEGQKQEEQQDHHPQLEQHALQQTRWAREGHQPSSARHVSRCDCPPVER
jgi:hypothetical protein